MSRNFCETEFIGDKYTFPAYLKQLRKRAFFELLCLNTSTLKTCPKSEVLIRLLPFERHIFFFIIFFFGCFGFHHAIKSNGESDK